MSEKVVQRLFAFVAILALLLGMGGTGPVSAQDPSPIPTLPRDTFPRDGVDLSLVTPLIEKGGTAKVVVILEEPSLVALHVEAQQNGLQMAPESAQAALASIRQSQETLQAQIESPSIGGTTLFKNQRAYNGIAIQVDGSMIRRIAALPGVASIVPLDTHTLDNAYAADLIGAKDVWNSIAEEGLISYTGKDVSIAIIDTGVDFLHANFGGDKNYEEAADATDDFASDDLNTDIFPTAKVVGGWDFAGDNYNANSDDPADAPNPDPYPMDCNGHGSHVAGSAAGYGVNDDGTTFNGPWTNSLNTLDMKIGPGMAPQADLYALRVFGCEGSTNLTDQAIDWALDPNGDGILTDHVDIINMSLGSDFGSQESSSTIAAEAAVMAGVIVVASSGNAGDTSYITGSPAVATRAINVAATVDAYSLMDGFRVNSPAGIAGVYGASAAVNWPVSTVNEVSGNLKYPTDLPNNRNGCAAFAPNYFQGQIALLDWTVPQVCGSVARANNATTAGAIGVLMIYEAPVLEIAIAGSSTVPSMITTQAVGAELKAALATGPVNVTLDSDLFATVQQIEPGTDDLVASFSSRGPRTGDVGLKPDIAAPGMTIFSTATGRYLGATGIEYGSGDDGMSINGTSMASPIVAGSMAILREQHRDWTAEELKALVMNTATSDIYTGQNQSGQVFSPVRVGAGRIDVQNATSSEVIAYNNDIEGAVSVSFGHVEVSDVYNEDITVSVANKGTSDATYNMAYRSVTDNPGVEFALRDMGNNVITSVTVPAGTTQQFKVTMTATAANLRNVRDLALTIQQEVAGGFLYDRIWLPDEAGLIEFTGTDLPNLRLPVHVTAVPVASMQAASKSFRTADQTTGTVNVTLAGTGVDTTGGTYTGYPEEITSLVSVFELAARSERLPTSSRLEQMADLQAVGIATDASKVSAELAAIYFGIAAYGEWNTPSELQFEVYFDTDGDEVEDFAIFTTPLRTSGGDATDILVTVLVDLATRQAYIQNYINFDEGTGANTQLLNNNVMVLPVYAADMGLSVAGDSDFSYYVVSWSAYSSDDVPVDVTDWLTYDIANPMIDVSDEDGGMPTYWDVPGAVIPIAYDRTGENAGKEVEGVLLLHHHNTEGARVEILLTRAIYLPILGR